jgi:autotransporter-associated beta strand protein
MNRTHRSLWNTSLGAWVAAPENTRARGKRSGIARASALTAALLFGGMPAAYACTAGNTAELAACITGNDAVIDLTASITLSGNLPVLERDLTINGTSPTGQRFVLDGAGRFRGFFIGSGTTIVNGLTMQNLRAQGGHGGTGSSSGGGGMGAGGAVFVVTGAGATLNDVVILRSGAVGGNGGSTMPGEGSGGGGGMGGNGGTVVAGANSAGRGGGGLFDDGGAGSGATFLGGNGGGPNGGQGGDGVSGQSGGLYTGGGGGGASSVVVAQTNGGNGGLGGGGGGGGTGTMSSEGGSGGFGGGGGGGGAAARGGAGGFGGGGGGGDISGATIGGFGGGSASGRQGGGGAGMGGAVFVMDGGSLTLGGNSEVRENSVTGGGGAQLGSAFGGGIFMQGALSKLVFATGFGHTQTVADAIADQTGSGGTETNAGSIGIAKTGDFGTLILAGANTYTGATTVAGTLRAGATNAFSAASAVTLGGGATLDLNNYDQTIGSLAGYGFVTLGTGTLTTGGDNTSTEFSGYLSGSGNFIKTGTGTLTLSRDNTNSGKVLIQEGTLRLNNRSQFGNATAEATVSSGATLDVNGSRIGQAIKLEGGTLANGDTTGLMVYVRSPIVLGSNGTNTISNKGPIHLPLSGVISGDGSVTLDGGGILFLVGDGGQENTYTGSTTINGNASLFTDAAGVRNTSGIANNGNLYFIQEGNDAVGQLQRQAC